MAYPHGLVKVVDRDRRRVYKEYTFCGQSSHSLTKGGENFGLKAVGAVANLSAPYGSHNNAIGFIL